eukprot:gene3608-3872_t
MNLEQQNCGKSLSLKELKELARATGAVMVVDRSIPKLQQQILGLQANLDSVFDALAFQGPDQPMQRLLAHTEVGTTPLQDKPLSKVLQQQKQLQCRHAVSKPRLLSSQAGASAAKPPDRWRRDNQAGTDPIYPDWWYAATPDKQRQDRQKQRKAQRPAPRLAYSKPAAHYAGRQDAVKDDLITAEYLLAPSSGYGQPPAVPVVVAAGCSSTRVTHINPDTITTQAGPQQQTPQQLEHELQCEAGRQQPHVIGHRHVAAASAAAARPRVRFAQVESRVKEAVAAARRQAAARHKRQQALLSSAVGTSSWQQQRQQKQHSDVLVDGDNSCPHAAASERFLQNSWAFWFMPAAASDVSAQHSSKCMEWDVNETVVPAKVVGEVSSHQLAAAVTPLEADEQPGELQQWQQEKEGLPGLQPEATSLDCIHALAATATGDSSSSKCSGDTNPAAEYQLSGRGLLPTTIDSNSWNPAVDGLQQQSQQLTESGPEANTSEMAREYTAAPDLSCRVLQQQLQRPSHNQRLPKGWAADYGHLEVIKPEAAVETVGAKSVAAVHSAVGPRRHRQWVDKWVGDFGHLAADEGSRFNATTAFSHHQLGSPHGQEDCPATVPQDVAAALGGPKCGGLFMSPEELITTPLLLHQNTTATASGVAKLHAWDDFLAASMRLAAAGPDVAGAESFAHDGAPAPSAVQLDMAAAQVVDLSSRVTPTVDANEEQQQQQASEGSDAPNNVHLPVDEADSGLCRSSGLGSPAGLTDVVSSDLLPGPSWSAASSSCSSGSSSSLSTRETTMLLELLTTLTAEVSGIDEERSGNVM